MKLLRILLGVTLSFSLFATPAFAAESSIASFTNNTLDIITLIAAAGAVLFLVHGGYMYLSSAGKPDVLEEAKKTIKNAFIGLIIVLAAGAIVSTLRTSLSPNADTTTTSVVSLTPVTTVEPSDGLTQVLIDAVSSFIKTLLEFSDETHYGWCYRFSDQHAKRLNKLSCAELLACNLGNCRFTVCNCRCLARTATYEC